MKNELENIFNEVYAKRKSNELSPAFIKDVEIKLKEKYDGRYSIICRAGTNTSLIFRYRNIVYYVYFLYHSDKFTIEYYNKH